MSSLFIVLTYFFTSIGFAICALNNGFIAMSLTRAYSLSPKLQSHPRLGMYFGLAVAICETSGLFQFLIMYFKADATALVRLCASLCGFAMSIAGLSAYFFFKGAVEAGAYNESSLESLFPIIFGSGAELMVILLLVIGLFFVK